MNDDLPLDGLRVLDLSTLLPGPMTTLALHEAGASVVKVERPGAGDEMRGYRPRLGAVSANYALLNRGKNVVTADLKDPADLAAVLDLAARSDIVLEQFRPGVADRLGLGYDAVRERNPGVVYCSISGYGQASRQRGRAAHDLNYLAESGLLGTVGGADHSPTLPPTVIADLAGGTYPALVNILLALRRRDRTGRGAYLDISMTHNLQVLAYGYVATHQGGGGWPERSQELLTGGSPRYRIYATADGRHLAVAALEDKFWARLTELVGLDPELAARTTALAPVIAALQRIFASRTAAEWQDLLGDEDVCVSVVASFAEAVEAGLVVVDHPYLVSASGTVVAGLHSIVDDGLRRPPWTEAAPESPTPVASAALWSEAEPSSEETSSHGA
ncbi:CaiB/BaiF CoA-transferase family protein [Nocardioides hungaricus]